MPQAEDTPPGRDADIGPSKEFGKAGKRVPLAKIENPQVVQRMKATATPKASPDSSDPELARIAQVESRPIPLSTEQHKLGASSAGLLSRARTDEHGIIEPPADKLCLNVRVSKEMLDRTLVFMNTLLFALEANSLTVRMGKASTSVHIFGQDVDFSIIEVLDVKERREEKQRYGIQEIIEYERSGRLAFKISTWADGYRKTWADGKTQRVETMLSKCIGGLMLVARGIRISEEERERRHREWEREERERAELARRIQEEEARLGDLEAKATNWMKAKRIRAFVTAFEKACRAKDAATTPDTPDGQWIAWARQQANRFDPLVESPPSVLDRKRESPSW